MIEEIEQGMILYTQGNKIKHDVAHFLNSTNFSASVISSPPLLLKTLAV